ncbi:MAG: hypothetical protein JJT96_12360 [Opitutales bacterium]|nr:hypothetical protein [Opitutales bacterium]
MKNTFSIYWAIACALLTALPLRAEEFHSFTRMGETFSEDFNAYRGKEATLPPFFSVTWDTARTLEPFTGVGNFFTTNPDFGYGAFTAFTADGVNHSFGIREREPEDLRDARLFFAFRNDTGSVIEGFEVSYDVEAWFRGDRLNRIRLKYDVILSSEERSVFETDIFSTSNPGESAAPGTKQDGSLQENRVTVSGFVDLSDLVIDPDDLELGTFGPLQPGEIAYFRWQFSNLSEGESGSLRSGLAINNVRITPVGEMPLPDCPEPGLVTHLQLGGLSHLGYCWALWINDLEDLDWGWIYSAFLDAPEASWIYHFRKGWLFVFPEGEVSEFLYLWSPDLGWLGASVAFGGQYFSYDLEAFVSWADFN